MLDSTDDILRAILRAQAEFKAGGLDKLRAWKPPPGRAWMERYNHAIRRGYSEKFAAIYASQCIS